MYIVKTSGSRDTDSVCKNVRNGHPLYVLVLYGGEGSSKSDSFGLKTFILFDKNGEIFLKRYSS